MRLLAVKCTDYYSSVGVDIDGHDFFGKKIDNIKEWRNIVKANKDLITAMAVVSGDADEGDQQEAMSTWIADSIRICNRAAGIMRMLYPDQKDAPWRKL